MDEKKILLFRLHEEEFALDINNVDEIMGTAPYTEIPSTPDYVKGIINFRGKVIPLIDLNLKLGFDEKKESDDTRIIVIERNESEKIGFLVDAVLEVMKIKPDDIRPPSPVIKKRIESVFIKGIIILGERLITLLDAYRILSDEERQKLSEHVSKPDKKFEVDEEDYFWFNDGKSAKSINQLREILIDLDDNVFREHVNPEKNDFSNWIRYVMEDDDLANRIQDLRTKEEILHALEFD